MMNALSFDFISRDNAFFFFFRRNPHFVKPMFQPSFRCCSNPQIRVIFYFRDKTARKPKQDLGGKIKTIYGSYFSKIYIFFTVLEPLFTVFDFNGSANLPDLRSFASFGSTPKNKKLFHMKQYRRHTAVSQPTSKRIEVRLYAAFQIKNTKQESK